MIAPTLFVRDERTGQVQDALNVDANYTWSPYELLRGASIRVTTRKGAAVRLESLHVPTPDERRAGVTEGWYREAGPMSTSSRWLWEALASTDLHFVPDGEWEGLAIGEKIFDNYHGLEGHQLVLYDLIPWAHTLEPLVPSPPHLGRIPLDHGDLEKWLPEKDSEFAPAGETMWGVVWYHAGSPVAQIEARDFLPYSKRKVMEE